MSSTYSQLTPYQLRWIDDRIVQEAWNRTKFLNFFMNSPGAQTTRLPTGGMRVSGGLIQSVDEGLEEITVQRFQKAKPGQISGGLQDIPRQNLSIIQESQPLMYLATKISIPVNVMDAWANNQFIKAGNMLSTAIAKAMNALTNQVDQFICYGDDFKTPLSNDILNGAGKFTGLFNGNFQSFAAGITADNDVTAAGDYIASYTTARKTLEDDGFDAGPYFILSDNATYNAAEGGNNIFTSNTPWTEARWILNEYGKSNAGKPPELADWIQSPNAFAGSASTTSRMVVTQPYISQRGQLIEPAYKLYVGYNFRVFPLWGGGLNGENMSYETVVAWSGRFQEFDTNACAVSGALTLT